MPALAGDLENEDVREGYAFVLAKFFNGSFDHILVLKRQMFVVEQHFDGFDDIFAGAVVNGIEDPGCLGQHQMGYPRSFGDELLSGLDLIRVVPRDESAPLAAANCLGPCSGILRLRTDGDDARRNPRVPPAARNQGLTREGLYKALSGIRVSERC